MIKRADDRPTSAALSAPPGGDAEVTVGVLPTPTHDQVRSMDRFADELVAALRAADGVRVTLPSVAGLRGGHGDALSARARRTASRFVAYPLRVRGMDTEVFHITDQSYGHLAATLPSRRVLVTCHDLMPLRPSAVDGPFGLPWTTEARYRMSVAFLRRVAHVACVSDATREAVINELHVDPSRTSTIWNGLSPRFRMLEASVVRAARTAFPPDTRLLLHVGSGVGYKNVEATIRVLAQLRAGGTPTILMRAGGRLTGPQRRVARELGVEDAVRDQGHVDDERLIELYNAADAFLFPSHWEGFGWPVLEALACGTPTVVSQCAALTEVAAGGALSAAADDIDGLTARVLSLWASPEQAGRLRDAGLARAAELTWDYAADQYTALYRRIAAGADQPERRATATRF